MRVDAHHHLWRYTEEEFGWIEDRAAALRHDFLPTQLEQVMGDAHIDLSVAVQARCTLDETHWLLACASQHPGIAGVVGWVPLADATVGVALDALALDTHFVGVREIVQDKAEGFLLRPSFNDGIRQLTARGLTYDLLIRAEQLKEATRFVDQHPHQAFVLDHAAKPAIAAAVLEPWRDHIRELAQRSNVLCKLSGLVTEADWQRWTEDDLHPYLDLCLEFFGPRRCMAGSDWPVCLTASGYGQWWAVLERWVQRLSAPDREWILGMTAATFYGLSGTEPPATPVHA